MSLVNFVSASELLCLPPPDALIENFVQEQDAVCLYGEPNGGKSFLALDWALCIATGKPWLDTHEVKQGPVVYMAGEGAASLQTRIQAWMRYHRIHELPGAYFQVRPLSLRDEETIEEIQDKLATFAEEERGAVDADLQPRLIVVDTLSQFMMGGDENGPDMALFVSNCRRLSHDNNTAVLIVHHTNATGQRERGGTALRGNVDAMFRCDPLHQNGQLIGLQLQNDKQRDKERAKPLQLKLQPYAEALVIVPTMAKLDALPTVSKDLLDVLQAMLCLEDEDNEKTRNVDIVNFTGQLKGTVHKRLERLAHLKLVKHREGKSALTTLGRAVLDNAGIKREEPEEKE
jgi:hypothetical protein